MRRLAVALLLHLSAGSALADSGMLLAGVANRQMPLDAVSALTACYSGRRLRTAYTANKGVNIVRASDSATSDVGFTPLGLPDTATETAFCNATTCKLVTLYDQCGSNNLTQGTDANRFTRQAGPGGFRASQSTANTQTHVGGSNITPATGVVSLAAIANRSAGTGACQWMRENGANNRMQAGAAQANRNSIINTGSILAVATDNAWFASAGVINGASSVLSVGGQADQAGTVTGNTTAAAPALAGAASTTCNFFESIVGDAAAWTAGQRSYYINGARTFGGF